MIDGGTGTLRRSRGLRAFGLLVAVWLNLALAPCSMAYESNKHHDCPGCPPAKVPGDHAMHGDMHGEMHHGNAVQAPCADDLADCMIDDEISHDGRGGQSKVDDAPQGAVALPASDFRDMAPVVSAAATPRYTAIHPGAPPPLHLLNCVFLD